MAIPRICVLVDLGLNAGDVEGVRCLAREFAWCVFVWVGVDFKVQATGGSGVARHVEGNLSEFLSTTGGLDQECQLSLTLLGETTDRVANSCIILGAVCCIGGRANERNNQVGKLCREKRSK